jgi:hypothetical protein
MAGRHGVKLEVPIRVESNANLREHWSARARRAKAQRETVAWCLRMTTLPDVPCTVKLTRIAPRMLDSDNAICGMKHVRDAVAAWLLVDDADPRVRYEYAQEKGQPGEYACRIEIEA